MSCPGTISAFGRLLRVELDLPQRAPEDMLVRHQVGERRLAQRAQRVDRVACDQRLAPGKVEDHRCVAQRVPRCEDHPHAAVAEDVVGAAEGGERLRPLRAEVEQAVVEGMVELAGHVSAQLPARLDRGGPLGAAQQERRRRVVGDGARMVEVEVGEEHQLDARGLDPACSQLVRHGLRLLHPDVLEGERAHATEVLLRVHCHGRVEAGVDQEVAETRVLDQERHHWHVHPLVGGHADPERARRGEAAVAAVEPAGRALHRGRQEWPQADGRLVPAARDRQRCGLRFSRGGHSGSDDSLADRCPARSSVRDCSTARWCS